MTQFINEEKINKACYYLMFTDKSLIEMSTRLSFSSQSDFQSIFKKIMDITPTEWRRKNTVVKWPEGVARSSRALSSNKRSCALQFPIYRARTHPQCLLPQISSVKYRKSLRQNATNLFVPLYLSTLYCYNRGRGAVWNIKSESSTTNLT